ncbi:MAG: MBL fold metallo-hydrolase [Candidatus Hermodarchaeota archaeon]
MNEFNKISENVFAFIGPANIVALVLPTKVVMIDVGRQVSEMIEIRKKIEEISKKKVEVVILTHFHSDHSYGLPAFSDCKIISSELLLQRLKQAKRNPPKGYAITLPNEIFTDYHEIQDGDVQIIIKQTGGHTDDSTYVYCPNYKIIATGDNLIVNGFFFAAKGCNPQLWIQALNEYLSLDVTHFIPGHGPVVDKNKVKEIINYMTNVRKVMKELIDEGKPEVEILKAAEEIEYYYTPKPQNKKRTLKSWFNFWNK